MKKIAFIAFIIFCFCSPSALADTQFTYANFFPPTHIQSKLADKWCKEVEKRTKGEIIIKYFPSGTLTKTPQTYDSVVSGIADI
jgi:TRAP-type transport system periplasmic protein